MLSIMYTICADFHDVKCIDDQVVKISTKFMHKKQNSQESKRASRRQSILFQPKKLHIRNHTSEIHVTMSAINIQFIYECMSISRSVCRSVYFSQKTTSSRNAASIQQQKQRERAAERDGVEAAASNSKIVFYFKCMCMFKICTKTHMNSSIKFTTYNFNVLLLHCVCERALLAASMRRVVRLMMMMMIMMMTMTVREREISCINI